SPTQPTSARWPPSPGRTGYRWSRSGPSSATTAAAPVMWTATPAPACASRRSSSATCSPASPPRSGQGHPGDQRSQRHDDEQDGQALPPGQPPPRDVSVIGVQGLTEPLL